MSFERSLFLNKGRMLLTIIVVLMLGMNSCTTLVYAIADVIGVQEESEIREEQSAGTLITVSDSGPERASNPTDGMLFAEFAAAEQGIFEIVNQHREQAGLPPLLNHSELGVIARRHSADMGTRGYYSHVDPDGVTPNERITDALSDRYYLLGTAENIAYRESSGGISASSDAGLARLFMDGWMNSPGHRANILRPESTHIGIGLSRAGNRVYATQKFMRYIAELEEFPNGSSLNPNDPVVRFAMNPLMKNQDSLIVRVDLPDPQARWPIANNRFSVGHGFIAAEWLEDNRFAVRLPVDVHGPGTYGIRLGDSGGNRTYTQSFRFHVPSEP